MLGYFRDPARTAEVIRNGWFYTGDLGYVDPDATVNIIRDGVLVEKRTMQLPEMLTNVIECKNPRCITSCEQGIEHEFVLADKEKRIYRCAYCESAYK